MTEKDLNLKLNQGWTRTSLHETPKGNTNHEVIKPLEDVSANRPTPENSFSATPSLRPRFTNHPWMLPTLLASNLLLILTGIVYLLNNHQPNQELIAAKPINSQLVPNRILDNIQVSQQRTEQKALDLANQVDQLELQLLDQQKLNADAINNVHEQLSSLVTSMKKAVATKKDLIKTKPVERWSVNLGTFSSREAAAKLQQQVLANGYSAEINETLLESKKAYRVQLQGFKNRSSAEETAHSIMEKTNLNGLWVSKSS